MNKIYVIDSGWILVGIPKDGGMLLKNAHVVRCWSNGEGIGALVNEDCKSKYTLDYIGDVELRESRIIFSIPCNW